MAFQPVPNVCELGMVFTLDNQRVQNVYHFKFQAPPDASMLSALVSDMVNWWETDMRDNCAADLIPALVYARDLTSETGAAVEVSGSGMQPGGVGTSPALPNNVTMAVRWGTGLRGRSYRGRTYHLGLCEVHVAGNRVDTQVASAIIGSYLELINTVSDEDRRLCVVSRFAGGSQRAEGVSSQIYSVTTDGIIDSQRRRLPGRGQ